MPTYTSELTQRLKPVLASLKKREERRAVKAALAHVTVDTGPGEQPRVRVLGSELHVEKPPKPDGLPERMIRVLVVDYGNRRIHDVKVDSRGSVAKGEVLRGRQPAFHPDEVRDAREIAERDERVAPLAKLDGSFAGAFAPHGSTEAGARLVGLRYLQATGDGGARPLATVSVDLFEGELKTFMDDTDTGGKRRRD